MYSWGDDPAPPQTKDGKCGKVLVLPGAHKVEADVPELPLPLIDRSAEQKSTKGGACPAMYSVTGDVTIAGTNHPLILTGMARWAWGRNAPNASVPLTGRLEIPAQFIPFQSGFTPFSRSGTGYPDKP